MECKCCGNWFASTSDDELCITCSRAMERLGLSHISYDRLRELVEADRDGQCTKHGYNATELNPVDEFICSECGTIFEDTNLCEVDVDTGDRTYYEYEFKYCPNCGAQMDGAHGEYK